MTRSIPMWAMLLSCRPPAPAAPTELSGLREGQVVEGFVVQAIYVDDVQRPLGARLVHQHTGFDLALMQLQTAPQAYLWVHTPPTGDQGEPHTQEHLLLGKGNRGRAVATLEDMSLVSSSAFTDQLHTVYHFHTTAGPAVFFDVLGARLDALLHPDYTDEEIRREVHHFGVRTEADGSLALEEKGTVYAEMDSTYQRPGAQLWRQIGHDLYGPTHPLAYESGGLPAAIRTMEPVHIRDFHAEHYRLANMGMITVLPTDVPLPIALSKLDGVLRGVQPEPSERADELVLPPPTPVAERAVRTVVYPSGDETDDGGVVLAYPPVRDLPAREVTLMGLLLSGIAGNEASNLHRAMVDSRERERDTGATDVWSWVSDDLGTPVFLGVGGIPGSALDDATVEWIATRMQRELATIAALPAGDPALRDLQRRLGGELVRWRRSLRKSVGSPPGFGARGTGTGWFDLLEQVDEDGGFLRSITRAPTMAWLEAQVARADNPWAELLPRWGLLEAPLVYANRPSAEALEALSKAKAARLDAELISLMQRYGTADGQEALAAFAADEAAITAELDAAAQIPDLDFVDAPPMSADPELDWSADPIAGLPALSARFDGMTGADVRLALRLDGVTEAQSRWLAVLPDLLTEVGVVEDGVPIPHTEVIERLQREVLGVGAWTSTNARTGRAELVMHGSGTDATEVAAAMQWGARFLTRPDLRVDNLPRIRDVVLQSLSGLQGRMQGSEESWVRNPQSAVRYGDSALQLRLWSFLTQAHDVHRLLWRLTEPGAGAGPAYARALGKGVGRLDREGLQSLLAVLQGREGEPPLAANRVLRAAGAVPEAEQPRVAEFAQGIERALSGIPDGTLSSDVAALCEILAGEWETSPADALAEVDALRRSLLRTGGARLVVAGGAWIDGAEAGVGPLVGVLDEGDVTPTTWPTDGPHRIRERVTARGGDGAAHHLGLLDPNRRSGVHVHRAPGVALDQLEPDAILRYLASNTWGGGGAHALFMRTWGAGLAYSNGISSNPIDGSVGYYAERCPSLGQTLDFVIDELEGAEVSPTIATYAVSNAFWSRSASGYEGRASAMAADLVDGATPERVEAFRRAVLAARETPELHRELQERLLDVYGAVVPGLGEATDPAGTFLVVGDDAQLSDWADWLQSKQAGGFERVYPRDFWLVD